jgi:hypothetical protein
MHKSHVLQWLMSPIVWHDNNVNVWMLDLDNNELWYAALSGCGVCVENLVSTIRGEATQQQQWGKDKKTTRLALTDVGHSPGCRLTEVHVLIVCSTAVLTEQEILDCEEKLSVRKANTVLLHVHRCRRTWPCWYLCVLVRVREHVAILFCSVVLV